MTTVAQDAMNPVAMQIGTLIGLFTKEQDNYTFNNSWFSDPWKYISAVPSNPEMMDLLATLMTSADGTALGTPRQLLNRTWYPVLNPTVKEKDKAKPTGIYIVTTKPVDENGEPIPGKPTELGIGALYEWTYDDFSLLPYAYFPVINLPVKDGPGFSFILGQGDHPVEVGIDATGSNGVFNTGNGDASLSFDGFKAATNIFFNGNLPTLDLTFINLKLPGEKQGTNRSLFDLIHNASVQQSITVALSVLGSQLAKMPGAGATAGKMVHSVLELLGLLGPVPGIDWNALVQNPANVIKIFTDWLQNITSNKDVLKSWLNDWYCLFKGLDSTDGKNYVTGEGTRLSPFSANLFSVPFTGTLTVDFDFTFATVTSKDDTLHPDGTLNMYPGFRVSTSPITPITTMPEFGVKVLAEAEVLCYSVVPEGSGKSNAVSFFPQYSILASAANTTAGKPLFSVEDTFGNHEKANNDSTSKFSIGSMNLGFIYNADADTTKSKIPSPNFRLHEVQTAIGSWPLIDLANFNVNTIEQAIGPAVSAAIKAFFGEDNKYAEALTTVLGIDPPKAFTGEWPLKDKMLLSADELGLLIKNPFAAIGAYYSRCLSTNDSEGKPLFKYIVPGFSALLGSDSTDVTGDGTEKAPWQIPILKVGSASLSLGLWKPADNNLSIAFDFGVPLPFTAISATFSMHAAMMVMQLPGNDGSGKWAASWMQALTGRLQIKSATAGKLETPAVGGVSIGIDDVYVQGGWKNTSSFFVSAGIDNLELKSTSVTDPIKIGNLEISTEGWSVEQLKSFTPAIVNGLGLLMLENGGKLGVFLTAMLGMLPNLPKIFDGYEHPEYKFPVPDYLILPEDWPTLKIENYSNPWKDVVNQVSALYSDGKFMIPLMQIVGWGITGSTQGAPDVIPIGTMADPWRVMLPDVFNIELLTWKENNQSGYGVRRQFSVNAAKSVQIATVLRADVPGIMLNGAVAPTNNYPGLSFVNEITNPDVTKPLVDAGGLVIGKVQIGAFLQLQNGALKFIPVFRFADSRLKDTEILRNIELISVDGKPQFTANDALDAFNSLVNAMMAKLSETIEKEGFTQLQAFLDILALYGILDVTEKEKEDKTKVKIYSFNPGSWTSILANPGGYLVTKTNEILHDDQQCVKLMKALAQLMGYKDFTLPGAWQGVQYLLQALALAKDVNGFSIPVIDNWLALIKSPVSYLKDSIAALFNNPELIKQLVTNITKPKPKTDALLKANIDFTKYFNVDSSGNIITVKIPTDKVVKIGEEIRLYASIVIDVKSYSVTNSVAVGSRTLDSALAFQWTPTYADGKLTSTYGFYLEGTPGAPQAFEPLQLWPFPTDTEKYLKQIGVQVPITLLSSFVVKYLNGFVVPKQPAVKNIFKVLGLTSTAEEGVELIKPLTGIFMDPVKWLMSTDVLGDANGNVDLSKLGGLLYAITDAAGIKNGNIELKAYEHAGKKDGVQLTGLPWGVSFILYANTEEGANLGGTFAPQLPSPAPNINLTAGIGFGTPNGLDIHGSIGMSYTLGKSSSGPGNNTLGITAAYAKKAFTLTANANTTEFKLLPFGGLNQFLNAGTAGLLLKIIGDKLFGAYNDYVTKHPDTKLKPFVVSIQTLTKSPSRPNGINDGATLFGFFDAIYQDPLGQFTEANITNVLPNINDFLTNILTLQGFSVSTDKKLLQYEHTFTSLPGAKVVINIGLRKIDDKPESPTIFGLWLEPVASYQWISIGLNKTGVGVVMPIDYNKPDLRYSVNISLGTSFSGYDIPNAPEPKLIFGLTGSLEGVQGPNLNFYPVKVSDAPKTLSIELLPTPQMKIAGQTDVTVSTWMINFGTEFLVPFMANTALSIDAVKNWLDKTKIGSKTGVPGQVLVDWGLLIKKEAKGKKEGEAEYNYYLNDLRKAFDVSKPIEIITKLMFSALNLLDGEKVVPIKNNGIYVQSETVGKKKRYGLRIQIEDIEVTSSLNKDGAKLVLQLGKYYGADNKDKNWTGLKSDPGIVVYFINKDTDDTTNSSLDFWPKFELISVGLDFAGANQQKPLINVKGVTIQSIEPRAYVSLDTDGLKTDFGAAMMLYNLGVPMGPGFGKTDNSNPVAQNLLSSGGDKGKTDAVNPSFSLATSYVFNSKTFNLQLYDTNDQPAEKVWISIMRAFGPLQCRKVGIGWKGSDKRLDFLFDGTVSLAGLMADLVDLDIGIPITNPTDFSKYSLDLAGLDVSYNAGAVSIGGGFLKDNSAGYIQYTGQAKIQTASFGIGAFGAYALIDDHPSLFIFAYLNAPLGGPPFFFIKGLSGGFGYNRTINIPPANQIENFPFVAGIDNPSALGGENGKPPTNESALQKLGTEIVPPQLGSYWVAAGIKFTSFELIDSNAVLMVIFGNDFEIALLGISGLKLPKTGKTYVGAQIAFKVTYKVSTGLLAMEAVLTSNSYVLDPNCKLTGGLAFYVWFKDQADTGARAGDFVFTLGGYHPAFKKPKYFPDEPRLGFTWSLGDVSIKGGAYFALTPSAVMAGGSLEAVYQSGNLKAWFTAYADFLIMWNPFHYDIRVGVSVGASYTVHFIWTTTFKVELGADVHIWGPEMAGSVTVHWWVISFTVDFGATGTDPNGTKIIKWGEFQPYFLPKDQAPPPPPQQQPEPVGDKKLLKAGVQTAAAATIPVQQVSHIKQLNGLIKELPNTTPTIKDKSPTLWQITADGFGFSVSTVVPLNTITIVAKDSSKNTVITSNVKFGIKPMGSVVFGSPGQMSTLTFTIKYNNTVYDKFSNWDLKDDTNGIPESLWGTVNDGKTSIDAKIIPGAMVGLTAKIKTADDSLPTNDPPMFPLTNLGYASWALRKLTLASNPQLKPTAPAVPSDQSLEIIENTIMSADVVALRESILKAVVNAGINVDTNGRLDQMAAYATQTFQSYPMLGELGSLGYKTTLKAAAVVTFNLSHPEPMVQALAYAPEPVRLRAVMLQYSRPALPSPIFMAASPDDVKVTYPVKGTMYSYISEPVWKVNAVKSGRHLNAAANDAAPRMEIYPGVSAILDLDPRGKAPLLKLQGNVPIFAAWFDEHNQLLGSEVLTADKQLPEGVAELMVNGLSTGILQMPYAHGWHFTSQLTLVNPNALTGIGAIIVPDSPVRVKNRRDTSGYGLIDGEDMVKANLIKTGEDTYEPAGIRNIMSGGLKTVAVLVSKKDKEDIFKGDTVAVKIKTLDNGAPKYVVLQPKTVIDGLYETAALYELPANTGYNYTLIYTIPGSTTKISGVMGLAEDAKYVADNWQKVVLQPAVPHTAPKPGEGTIITIE